MCNKHCQDRGANEAQWGKRAGSDLALKPKELLQGKGQRGAQPAKLQPSGLWTLCPSLGFYHQRCCCSPALLHETAQPLPGKSTLPSTSRRPRAVSHGPLNHDGRSSVQRMDPLPAVLCVCQVPWPLSSVVANSYPSWQSVPLRPLATLPSTVAETWEVQKPRMLLWREEELHFSLQPGQKAQSVTACTQSLMQLSKPASPATTVSQV